MLKNLLTVLIVALVSFLCTAEEKIAIVGDSDEAKKVADLVSGGLSSQYSVMERGETEKLLKERKLSTSGITSKEILALSKVVHVDYFITISSSALKKKTIPSRLLLFDAANGFRLLDKALPEDIEKAAEYSVEGIKKVLSDSQKTEGRKFLSVLSVRNAGAPKRYEADFANIAIEVEQSLASAPGVAILERESLGMVNQERKISESFSRLKTSAYLLDFDFLPGPEVSHVDLLLNILDPTGKQLSQIKVDDCLKDPNATIKTVLAGLSKFLSMPVSPTDSVSDKKEAERFFNEYKFCDRIGDMNSAERKLEAAIALNSDSPQYRIELALFIIKKAGKSSKGLKDEATLNNMIDISNKAIDIQEETHARFPDYSRGSYIQMPISHIDCFWADKRLFSKSTQERVKELARRYREHCLEELKKTHKFDLTRGVSSLKELRAFKNYCRSSSYYIYYMDIGESMMASFNSSAEFLTQGGEFLKKNPGILKDIPYEKQIDLFVIFPDHSHTPKIPDNISEMLIPLVDAAKDHPSPAVKIFGKNAALITAAISSNFDKDKFAAAVDELLEEVNKSELPLQVIASTEILTFSRVLGYHKELLDIYCWKQIEYARKTKQTPDLKIVAGYLSRAEPPKLLSEKIGRLEPELQYFLANRQGPQKNEIEDFFCTLKNQIPKTPEYEKALQILNDKAAITCKAIAFLKSGEIIATCENDGKIYILTKDSSDNLHIFSFNPRTETLRPFENSRSFSIGFPKRMSYEYQAFGMSEKYFLVGGHNKILAIPRNGGNPYVINDLPGEDVNAITMMDDRIYAFLGRINMVDKTFARESILASFLPDGSDRKIHISTLRKEKLTDIERFSPFTVHALFADTAKKRLIFTAGYPANGLWEFNPETGKTRQLISCKNSGNDNWGMRTGNALFLGFHDKYYRFDINDDSVDFIFFSEYKNNSRSIKKQHPRYIRQEEQDVRAPFFSRENQLWFGHYKIIFISPDNISQSKQIIIPQTQSNIFYPHPDGVSVYAFSGNGIYKLTPQ